ncbi:LysR substrate-binding domain-containing protein [Rhizobium leguminosarum]|uniref:LysR family transcriptional regulator n=1 Tax=Rhizobium leguminosarum TaxID=384 RepID=UPI001C9391FC|nr:LysR substrate-binding domain-containing protein [Rhizobium leguminosarum]MBY5377278.1 LysR family transcriptional regulator [Rhizobium leguminosarum]
MDVGQLKTLIHVAEVGSLSRAAERMNIAQPALSRQVRLLEEELGVQLFERHGRGMIVTPAGEDVLHHAAKIMSELDAIRACASTAKKTLTGVVQVGTTPTVAEFVTVPLMQQAGSSHPSLSLRFTSAFSGHLMEWLKRGELDVALSYDPDPQASLRIEPIMVENLLLIGPPSQGLRLDGPIAFEALARLPLVLPSPRHGLRRIVEECADRAFIKLTSTVEVDSFGAMIALAQNGFGCTVLPLPPVYDFVKRGLLTAAPLIDPVPSRRLVVAFAADRPTSAAARFIGNTFRSIASGLVHSDVWPGHMIDPSEKPTHGQTPAKQPI